MSIKFENVFFTYQENTPFCTHALNNINLEINDNEFVGLIGHTGSGKSTLVQHINALLRPSKGVIKVGDYEIIAKAKKIKNLKNLKKYAGLVFQFPEYQLFEDTVLKDVSYGPKNFGDKEEEAILKAKKALKLVGISEDLFEKSPFELSGGQKRRVAIAGIIALEPKILVLDEPTAGLDPKGAKDMMELFNVIHNNGTTIVMVTHNMDNVLKYCSRAIVMSKGEIISDSTPLELFSYDNLNEKYNIDQPIVLKYAKELIKGGLKLDLNKIIVIDNASLVLQDFIEEFKNKDIDKKFYALREYKRIKVGA